MVQTTHQLWIWDFEGLRAISWMLYTAAAAAKLMTCGHRQRPEYCYLPHAVQLWVSAIDHFSQDCTVQLAPKARPQQKSYSIHRPSIEGQCSTSCTLQAMMSCNGISPSTQRALHRMIIDAPLAGRLSAPDSCTCTCSPSCLQAAVSLWLMGLR